MLEYGLEWHTLDSYFQMKQQSSAPGTPQTDQLRLYAKDSGGVPRLFYKSDNGTEYGPLDTSVITGSGTANRLAYWSSSSVLDDLSALTQNRVMFPDSNGLPTGDSSFVWDNTNKDLLIGQSSHPVSGFVGRGFLVGKDGTTEIECAAGGNGGNVVFRAIRARNTIASPQAIQADDGASFALNGHDGSSFATGASATMQLLAGSTWTGSNHETYIRWLTTNNAATTQTEKMRLTSAGFLGVGRTPVILVDIQGSASTTGFAVERSGGPPFFEAFRVTGSQSAADEFLGWHGAGGSHTGLTADRAVQALVGFYAGEAWGASAKGEYITFETTPTSSTTRAERWRVTPAGIFRALAGGTIQGGASSGNSLTLSSTEHATKGSIIFGSASAYDEVNDRLGIGTTSPASPFVVTKTFQGSLSTFTHVSATPSGSDNQDRALGSTSTISANSATNHLVQRGCAFNVTNSLTGGGTVSNLRCFDVAITASASTTTSEAVAFYISASGSGTVTKGFGTKVTGVLGTTKVAHGMADLTGGEYMFEFPADATDPTGGGGAATGRIKCLIGGVTRYIPYY